MTQLSIRDRIEARRAVEDPTEPDLSDLRITPATAEAGPAKKRWRSRLAGLVALAAAGGGGYALYQSPAAGDLLTDLFETQPAQDPQTTASTEPQTPFEEHVVKAGIKTCSQLFPAMGRILTRGSSYGVNTQWNSSSPDSHPVQAVAGMKFELPDYAGQAVGVVFASPVGALCEGNLVRVVPVQKTCEDVVKTFPAGSRLADTLAGSPLYDFGDQSGQALLVPSGSLCVVVTVAQIAEQN